MILKNNVVVDAEALDNIRQRNDGLFGILYDMTMRLFDVDFQKMHENQQAVIVNTLKRYNLLIIEDQNTKDFFQIENKNLPDINFTAQQVYNEVFVEQCIDYDGEQ